MAISHKQLDDIIELIACTGNAASACRQIDVPMGTFWRHLAKDASLLERYARAKSQGMDALAEEIFDLSDRKVETDLELAQRRLQIDARKWTLSKIAPKKYGDRMIHAGDQENPIGIQDVTGAREILAGKFGVAAQLAGSGKSGPDSETD